MTLGRQRIPLPVFKIISMKLYFFILYYIMRMNMACSKEPAIKEGVESVMGGKVIYDEIDKIFDEGVKSGE